MRNCSVPGCKVRGGLPGYEKVSFHDFPKNPEIRQKWLDNLNRIKKDGSPWQPARYSKVCSLHFTDNCFKEWSESKKKLTNKILYPSAFPTKKLPVASSDLKHKNFVVDPYEQTFSPAIRKGPSFRTPSTPPLPVDPLIIKVEPTLLIDNDFDMSEDPVPIKSEPLSPTVEDETEIHHEMSMSTVSVKTPPKKDVEDDKSNSSMVDQPCASSPTTMSHDELLEENKALKQRVAELVKEKYRLKRREKRNEDITKSSVKHSKQSLQQFLSSKSMISFLKQNRDLVLNLVTNQTKRTKHKFKKSVRNFAILVYLYSPKLYVLLRKTFVLPSLKFVRKWKSKSPNILDDARTEDLLDNEHQASVKISLVLNKLSETPNGSTN